MDFTTLIKQCETQTVNNFASSSFGDVTTTTRGNVSYGIKATYGAGSNIEADSNGKSNRVYKTYNCQTCQGEVSIRRAKKYCQTNFTCNEEYNSSTGFVCNSGFEYSDLDGHIVSSYVQSLAAPHEYARWVQEDEARNVASSVCARFCFGGCYNSFVGAVGCPNSCNSSCTGSTSTPQCSFITTYSDSSSGIDYYCIYDCQTAVDCLQQCNAAVGSPCFWCVIDTVCNGCVFGCTSACANATKNYPENCHSSATAGAHFIGNKYCQSCDGMTGRCNTVCNATTSCASCTTGCTTQCALGCHSRFGGQCSKYCNTSCYGTCTTSCTCGCTGNYYSGCASSNYL